jgi:hypothetical protein
VINRRQGLIKKSNNTKVTAARVLRLRVMAAGDPRPGGGCNMESTFMMGFFAGTNYESFGDTVPWPPVQPELNKRDGLTGGS